MMRRATTRFNGAGYQKFSTLRVATTTPATRTTATTSTTTCASPTKFDADFIWKAHNMEMDKKEQEKARMMAELPPAHPAAVTTVSHSHSGVAFGFGVAYGVMTSNNEASVIRFELLNARMTQNQDDITSKIEVNAKQLDGLDKKVTKENDARKEETRLLDVILKTNDEQLKNLVKDEAESRKKSETKIADDLSKLSTQQQSNKAGNEHLSKKLNEEVASRERGETELANDLSKLTQEQRSSNDANISQRMVLVPWDLKKNDGWSEPFSLWGHKWKLGMRQCGPSKWELNLVAADYAKWAAPVTFKIKKASRETETFEENDALTSQFLRGRACEISSDDYDSYAHDGRLAVHIEMFSPPCFEAS